VAQLLGAHRHTLGPWLALYETGGLAALLSLYVPAGKPLEFLLDMLAATALRQWVRQTHHLDVHSHTLYTIVRTCFRTKLKVPRPRHTKNP
jgi:hypothetical protein